MNWPGVAQQTFTQILRKKAVTIKRFTGATARWRKLCLERDGYRCVLCHIETDLEVHHLQRWIEAPHLRLRKTNGATLCKQCHTEGHRGEGADFPIALTERIKTAIAFNGKMQSKPSPKVLIKKHLGITMPNF